jgi:ADP-heptose:LPS heptosyltransferase
MNILKLVTRSTRFVVRRLMRRLTSPRASLSLGEPFFRFLGMRKRRSQIRMDRVERAVVVRLDEIGDVVLTTPFLRELRRNLPKAWITLVVNPAVYNLVELCSYVNEVLTYDWRVSDSFSSLWIEAQVESRMRRHGRALRLAYRYLWRRRFDLAILPRWDEDDYHGRFLTYFSGAPWRVGYSERVNPRKAQSNSGFDKLLTQAVNDNTVRHEVVYNLGIISSLGGKIQRDDLELWLGTEDKLFAEQALKDRGVGSNRFLIAFGPGASDPRRRWPLNRFTELGAYLKHKYDARILIIGGPEEEFLGRELHTALGNVVINMVGKTTLRQTAALLAHCHLYVGNDSGPKHMAAAMGVAAVEVSSHPASGLPQSCNSPVRFGPWGIPCRVLQPLRPRAPCDDGCKAEDAHCILEVTVEHVKQAVTELLESNYREPREQVVKYAE